MRHSLFKLVASVVSPSRGFSPRSGRGPTGFGPKVAALVCSCALVSTGHVLGMTFLAETLLGVPAGLWLVGLCVFAVHVAGVRSSVRAEESRGDLDVAPSLPELRASDAGEHTVPERVVAGVLSRVAPSRADTLRVGVDAPLADFESLQRALPEGSVGSIKVIFERAEAGLVKDGPVHARRYDALLRRGPEGGLHLFVPTQPDRPAAWADWGEPMMLGYPAMFPVRLDCARATLGPNELTSPSMASLAAHLAALAAGLGRSPARLPIAKGLKSLRGRASLPGQSAFVEAATRALASDLIACVNTQASVGMNAASVPGLIRASARVLSALMTTQGGGMPVLERVKLLEACASGCADEPEVLLRLAAGQLGAEQREQGLSTLEAAASKLRAGEHVCDVDPLPYVLSEAELGAGDVLAIGRVAAGVTLACAAAPEDRVAYIREDLADDLRHASRRFSDAEAALLQRVLDQVGSESVATKRERVRARAA